MKFIFILRQRRHQRQGTPMWDVRNALSSPRGLAGPRQSKEGA